MKAFLKKKYKDFSGGTEDKKLPANTEDMGLIPVPGRSHTSWSKEACAL